jgi:hypothetical protein
MRFPFQAGPSLLRVTLFATAVACLAGSSQPRPPAKPAIQVFDAGEGLPSTTVHDIQLDQAGRLWIATGDGAAVYNGRHWTPVAAPKSSAACG